MFDWLKRKGLSNVGDANNTLARDDGGPITAADIIVELMKLPPPTQL